MLNFGSVLDHRRGYSHLWIEVANLLFDRITHPRTVTSDILGEATCSGPIFMQVRLSSISKSGTYWPHPRKSRRNFDHRLVYRHRNRVQVRRVALQPQALRLQRDGAAAGEGVVEGGEILRVEQLGRLRMVLVELAGLAPGAADLGAGAFEDFLVVGVLPLHQVFNDLEQALALEAHCVFPGA